MYLKRCLDRATPTRRLLSPCPGNGNTNGESRPLQWMSGVHTGECCPCEGSKRGCTRSALISLHGAYWSRPHQNRAGPFTCAHAVRSVLPKLAKSGGTIWRHLTLREAEQLWDKGAGTAGDAGGGGEAIRGRRRPMENWMWDQMGDPHSIDLKYQFNQWLIFKFG